MSSTPSDTLTQTDLRLGTGADAATGRRVTVNYTGWYYNAANADQKGASFDSSLGTTSFSFVLGVGEVIAGWDTGVAGMKVGGIRRLIAVGTHGIYVSAVDADGIETLERYAVRPS